MINKKHCIYIFFLIAVFVSPSILFSTKTSSAEIVSTQSSNIFIDESGHEMVFVPAGTFEFGISRDKLEWFCENEQPDEDFESCIDYLGDYTGALNSYEVDVEGFWMDKYEVTIEQYSSCVDWLGCSPIDMTPMPQLSTSPQQPQIGVSWYDAMFYCNMRGGRLPTEVEWEYAASGSANNNFPWGSEFVREFVTIPEADEDLATYPVGSVPENRSWVGIYDMAGNVAEWVEDRYVEHLNELPDRDVPNDYDRVIRVGAWDLRKFTLTTFWRDFEIPWVINQYVGFRCVSKHNLE